MFKILWFVWLDIVRSRTLLAYTAFLFLACWGIFMLEGNPSKSILSLINLLLIVIPLVSVIYSTIHLYNSYEFIELMLTQPVRRNVVFAGCYTGVGMALCLAFVLGIGIPLLIYDRTAIAFAVLAAGLVLTLVFVSVAFLCAVLTRDKVRGTGLSILAWFFFAILYDALLLLLLFAFADYPVEKILLAVAFLNPIDLARLMVLLKMDVAALMGMTGALFSQLLGSSKGLLLASVVSLIWIAWPFLLAMNIFRKKDI